MNKNIVLILIVVLIILQVISVARIGILQDNLNITPKETKEDTNATLYVSGESVAMTKKNDTTFTATLPAAIFGTFEAKVVLNDSGIQKTEKLDISENLRDRIFPTVIVRFEGKSGNTYTFRRADGFFHKSIVDKFALDKNADPAAEDNNIFMGVDIITDKDGNILYDPQYDKMN